jgi:leucyl aminopeptidase
VNLARDLVNCPANDLTATDLANVSAAEAKAAGVVCKVYDKKAIERLGMPLLLAVNRGSTEEPRFVHLAYLPKASRRVPRVVFVGKGLTFDSGGLCLKTADQMAEMKIDMGGAAVTLGAVLAAARLGLPIEVHGLIASTDNMNGGNAYRPGDVFPSRDGKTVEIINTDAEGRLVLADALAYARELKPTYIVDHATLTGACMVALGNYRAGLFSNDDELRTRYQAAAERVGEAFWHMPLDESLRDQLKSPIADLKHTGTRYGGAITAALFLREFVGKSRWVHLDIAGPVHLDKPHGIHPKGATGFGVRTAVAFLEALAS